MTETKPSDLDLDVIKSFYTKSESMNLFKALTELESIVFESRDIKLFGKTYKQPRLISWHGDKGAKYEYSKQSFEPKKWTSSLLLIRKDIEQATKEKFNSVLLNLYRDGQDSMGLHSDDEKELGSDPIIASLSLGETRRLRFVHKEKKRSFNIELETGDLIVMKGKTQMLYKHELPKSKKSLKARLNLTFRKIL